MSLVLVLTEVCYLSFAPGLFFFLKNKTSYKISTQKLMNASARSTVGGGCWAVGGGRLVVSGVACGGR